MGALDALLPHPDITRVESDVVAGGPGAEHHHAATLHHQAGDRERRLARMLEHDVDVVLAGDVPDRLAELACFLDPGVVFRRADLGHLTPTGKILAVRVWSGRQESWAAPGPASAMRRCRRRRPVVDHRQLTPGLRQHLSNR